MIYLQLSKQFAWEPNQKLLSKIKADGIKDKVWKQIWSWLSCSEQRVLLNDEELERDCITGGAPKGFVLGSLLYIICISDVDSGTSSNISKFVDIKIYIDLLDQTMILKR